MPVRASPPSPAQDPGGLPSQPACLQQRKEFPQVIQRNSIDVKPFAAKLAERVQEHGSDEGRFSELPRNRLEGMMTPFLDELSGLLLMDPELPSESRNGYLWLLRQVLADFSESVRRDPNRGHVGLRIHPRFAREGTAVCS